MKNIPPYGPSDKKVFGIADDNASEQCLVTIVPRYWRQVFSISFLFHLLHMLLMSNHPQAFTVPIKKWFTDIPLSLTYHAQGLVRYISLASKPNLNYDLGRPRSKQLKVSTTYRRNEREKGSVVIHRGKISSGDIAQKLLPYGLSVWRASVYLPT